MNRNINNMIPQAQIPHSTDPTSLLFSLITAIGIVILILFSIMALCTILTSFLILILYILCECISRALFDQFDIDPELGTTRPRRARILTYQPVLDTHNFGSLELIEQNLRSTDERRALRQQALEKLIPPMCYKSTSINSGFTDCAICLDDYQDGELCRVLPACEHIFHSSCIDKWLNNNLTCPVCRKCILDS